VKAQGHDEAHRKEPKIIKPFERRVLFVEDNRLDADNCSEKLSA
jgi:hypothetical protein